MSLKDIWNAEDMVEMAYHADDGVRSSISARRLKAWNGLTSEGKKVFRREARRVWEKALVDSWLSQNGFASLTKRFPQTKGDENQASFFAFFFLKLNN